MIKNFLNPEGHQNPITGSKVRAILLKGWILRTGEASAGEDLRLQPAQQACSQCHSKLHPLIPIKVLLNQQNLTKKVQDYQKLNLQQIHIFRAKHW